MLISEFKRKHKDLFQNIFKLSDILLNDLDKSSLAIEINETSIITFTRISYNNYPTYIPTLSSINVIYKIPRFISFKLSFNSYKLYYDYKSQVISLRSGINNCNNIIKVDESLEKDILKSLYSAEDKLLSMKLLNV